jgi:hypothetical protein
MKFYLNQKSLPMIRKCGNCTHYHKDFMSCGKHVVTNAYDYLKKIYLTTGENLYCQEHAFRNESTLREDAIVVEYDSIQEAMEVIRKAKEIKELKNDYNEENY